MRVKLEIEIDIPETDLSAPEIMEATYQHVLNAAYISHLNGVINSLGKPGHESIVAVHRTWADFIDRASYTITAGSETFTKP